MTQRQMVLEALREGGERGVTTYELPPVTHKRRVVEELKRLGHQIASDKFDGERIYYLLKDAHYCDRCGEYQVKPRKNLRCIWCEELEALAKERVKARA